MCITFFHWLKKQAWPITNRNPKMRNISRHYKTGDFLTTKSHNSALSHTWFTPATQVLEYIPLKIRDMKTTEIMFWKKTLTSTQGCRRKKKKLQLGCLEETVCQREKTRSDTGRHLSCPEFILVFIIHGTLNSSKCLGSGGVWQPHGPGISSCDQFKRFVSETASRQKTLDPAAKQLHWVFHLKLVLSGNKQTTGGLFPPLGGLPVTAAEYWSVDGAEGRCEVKVWWRDSGGGAQRVEVTEGPRRGLVCRNLVWRWKVMTGKGKAKMNLGLLYSSKFSFVSHPPPTNTPPHLPVSLH